jgi:hypothetical protein
MSSEAPPTYNVSIFIPSYWADQTTSGFDKTYADTHYLKFPVAQGTEYMTDLVVSGTTTLGATSASSLNMGNGNITNVTNINGSAYPQAAGINAVLAAGNSATNKTMIMYSGSGGGTSNNLQLDGDDAYFYSSITNQTSTLSKTGLIINDNAIDCNITKDVITLTTNTATPAQDKTEIFNDGIDLTGSSATITNKLTPISSIIADGTYTATLISNALNLYTNAVTTARNAISNTGMILTGSTTSVLNTIVASSNTITDGTRTLLFGISSSVATIKLNAAASGGNSTLITPNSIYTYVVDGASTAYSQITGTNIVVQGASGVNTTIDASNCILSGSSRYAGLFNTNYNTTSLINTGPTLYLGTTPPSSSAVNLTTSAVLSQTSTDSLPYLALYGNNNEKRYTRTYITSNYFESNADVFGYTTSPQLKIYNGLQNPGNTNGVASIQFLKNGRNSQIGDIISSIHSYALASTTTTNYEYSRIQTTIRNNVVSGSNIDGAIQFQTAVNNVMTTILELNGDETQINAFQPLDMNNNSIVSSTGSITLNASASSGTGNITLTPKSAGGYIYLNNLPISAGPSGSLYNSGGVLMVSP